MKVHGNLKAEGGRANDLNLLSMRYFHLFFGIRICDGYNLRKILVLYLITIKKK